jgi:Uncharacterized conserved protein
MSQDNMFETVSCRGVGTYVDQGSEFIAIIDHVSSVVAAKRVINHVRREYTDASHIVPAYRVPARDTDNLLREYADDDGEPANSAGKPVLNVLVQRDLQHVVTATVRYYGGTNLGVGRLARAYAKAVSAAISDAGIRNAVPRTQLTITAEYDDSGTIRGILDSENITFEASYDAQVEFEIEVSEELYSDLTERLLSATHGRATISTSE